jgi:hypothetical protein
MIEEGEQAMTTLHRTLAAGSLAAMFAVPALAGPIPTNVAAVKSAADSGITQAAWGGWGHGHWGGHWGHGGWGFPGAFLGGLALGAVVGSYPYGYGYGYGYPYGYAYYDAPAYAYYGGPYYGGYYGHRYWGRPYWRHRWYRHW